MGKNRTGISYIIIKEQLTWLNDDHNNSKHWFGSDGRSGFPDKMLGKLKLH